MARGIMHGARALCVLLALAACAARAAARQVAHGTSGSNLTSWDRGGYSSTVVHHVGDGDASQAASSSASFVSGGLTVQDPPKGWPFSEVAMHFRNKGKTDSSSSSTSSSSSSVKGYPHSINTSGSSSSKDYQRSGSSSSSKDYTRSSSSSGSSSSKEYPLKSSLPKWKKPKPYSLSSEQQGQAYQHVHSSFFSPAPAPSPAPLPVTTTVRHPPAAETEPPPAAPRARPPSHTQRAREPSAVHVGYSIGFGAGAAHADSSPSPSASGAHIARDSHESQSVSSSVGDIVKGRHLGESPRAPRMRSFNEKSGKAGASFSVANFHQGDTSISSSVSHDDDNSPATPAVVTTYTRGNTASSSSGGSRSKYKWSKPISSTSSPSSWPSSSGPSSTSSSSSATSSLSLSTGGAQEQKVGESVEVGARQPSPLHNVVRDHALFVQHGNTESSSKPHRPSSIVRNPTTGTTSIVHHGSGSHHQGGRTNGQLSTGSVLTSLTPYPLMGFNGGLSAESQSPKAYLATLSGAGGGGGDVPALVIPMNHLQSLASGPLPVVSTGANLQALPTSPTDATPLVFQGQSLPMATLATGFKSFVPPLSTQPPPQLPGPQKQPNKGQGGRNHFGQQHHHNFHGGGGGGGHHAQHSQQQPQFSRPHNNHNNNHNNNNHHNNNNNGGNGGIEASFRLNNAPFGNQPRGRNPLSAQQRPSGNARLPPLYNVKEIGNNDGPNGGNPSENKHPGLVLPGNLQGVQGFNGGINQALNNGILVHGGLQVSGGNQGIQGLEGLNLHNLQGFQSLQPQQATAGGPQTAGSALKGVTALPGPGAQLASQIPVISLSDYLKMGGFGTGPHTFNAPSISGGGDFSQEALRQLLRQQNAPLAAAASGQSASTIGLLGGAGAQRGGGLPNHPELQRAALANYNSLLSMALFSTQIPHGAPNGGPNSGRHQQSQQASNYVVDLKPPPPRH